MYLPCHPDALFGTFSILHVGNQFSEIFLDFVSLRANTQYADSTVDCRLRERPAHTLSHRLSLLCPALSSSSARLLHSLSLSLRYPCDIQNISHTRPPRNAYTWPRIDTLLSLENKDLDSRFSPLCGSLPRRRSHPGTQGEGVRWLKEPRTEN